MKSHIVDISKGLKLCPFAPLREIFELAKVELVNVKNQDGTEVR